MPNAIENYQKALGMKPDFGLAHYNLGLAYRDSKQTDQAIAAFPRRPCWYPAFWMPTFSSAKLYFDAGKKGRLRNLSRRWYASPLRARLPAWLEQYLDLLEKVGK